MPLWLVLLGLIAAIAGHVLPACGLGGSDSRALLNFCPAAIPPDPRPARLAEQQEEEQALRRRLARLQLALVEAPACPTPPVQVAEAPPEPPPQPEPPAEQPPPEPTPPEPPPPEAPRPERRPTPPPAPRVDIPEQQWRNRDVSFLEGCWTLISHYEIHDIDTGRVSTVRSWRMCFDGRGSGSQILTYSDGTTCRSTVGAAFNPGGTLRIDDRNNVPCSNGAQIIRRVISCRRLPNGTAQCGSRQPGHRNTDIPVVFRR